MRRDNDNKNNTQIVDAFLNKEDNFLWTTDRNEHYKPIYNVIDNDEPYDDRCVENFFKLYNEYLKTLLSGKSYELANSEILSTVDTAMRIAALQIELFKGAADIEDVIKKMQDISPTDIDDIVEKYIKN